MGRRIITPDDPWAEVRNGMPLIEGPELVQGDPAELTALQIYEYMKFLKIVDRESKNVPFLIPPEYMPYKTQEKLMETVFELWDGNKVIRIVILKARRLGSSAWVEAYIFTVVTLIPFRSAMVVAHRNDAASRIFRMTKHYYNHLPHDKKLPTKYNNKRAIEYEFPHESYMEISTAKDVDASRGEGLSDLHESELAYYRDPAAGVALGNSVPRVPRTSIFYESTANSMNEFYDRWQLANMPPDLKTTELVPIFIDWRSAPFTSIPLLPGEVRYYTPEEQAFIEEAELTPEQAKWYQVTKTDDCNNDQAIFNQEHPITPEHAFMATGTPFFAQEILKLWQTAPRRQDPIFRGHLTWSDTDEPHVNLVESKGGTFIVWKEPEPDYWYVIGVDVGMGVLADWTVMYVIRRPRKADEVPEVVAQFRSNSRCDDPAECAVIAYQIGQYYKWALLGIENNGPGGTMLSHLVNCRRDVPQIKGPYPNLYYHRRIDRETNEATMELGWPTRTNTRDRMLQDLKALVNRDEMIFHSVEGLAEMRGFAWDAEKEKYLANHTDPVTRMKHDDCIIALAIGNQMVDVAEKEGFFRKPMTEVE
jgi:hypothetical protein